MSVKKRKLMMMQMGGASGEPVGSRVMLYKRVEHPSEWGVLGPPVMTIHAPFSTAGGATAVPPPDSVARGIVSQRPPAQFPDTKVYESSI